MNNYQEGLETYLKIDNTKNPLIYIYEFPIYKLNTSYYVAIDTDHNSSHCMVYNTFESAIYAAELFSSMSILDDVSVFKQYLLPEFNKKFNLKCTPSMSISEYYNCLKNSVLKCVYISPSQQDIFNKYEELFHKYHLRYKLLQLHDLYLLIRP